MMREKYVRFATLYNSFFVHAMYDVVRIASTHINVAKHFDTYIELQKQAINWKNLLLDTLDIYTHQTDSTDWFCSAYTVDCNSQTEKLLEEPENEFFVDFSKLKSNIDSIGKLDAIFNSLQNISSKASKQLDSTKSTVKTILNKKQTGVAYCSLPLSILEFFMYECDMYRDALKQFANKGGNAFFVPKEPIVDQLTYLIQSIDKKFDFEGFVESLNKAKVSIEKSKNYDLYYTMLPTIGNTIVRRKVSLVALPITVDHFIRYAYATKINEK